MARAFDDGSSQCLDNANAVVTAEPITMAAWFNCDDNTIACTIAAIGGFADGTGLLRILRLRGDQAGDPISVQISGGGVALTSNGFSANTWHHAFGVFATSTSRTVILDGDIANKGTSTASVSQSAAHDTFIGALAYSSAYSDFFSGSLGEIAMWNVALTDIEGAILATGISPLAVRPQSLSAYWPLIGRTSPEIDIVGGYDMTLNGGPTTAAHPPIMYPVSPQIISIPTVGGGTLGRMYSVSNTVAGVTAATDLLRISAPTDAVVAVHKVIVTQETEFGDAASEQVDVMFHRGSTDGSGGATPTASPLEVGDAAFGGSCATGNTTQSTDGTILHREAVNVMAGMYWSPTPEERIVLSPSGRFIASLETAPDDSIDFRVTAYFEEIGG